MPTIAELFNQAIRHYQSGQRGLAENLCRQILHADPRHGHAWHFLGIIADQAGRPALAVEYLGNAIRCLPNFAEAHFHLGNILIQQGKLEEAAGCYRQAILLQPGHAEARCNLAVVFQEQGRWEEAKINYREALRLKPDYAEAYSNLGSVLCAQDELEEAMACCQEALRLRPGFTDAHINLGNVLRKQGKLDEAEACCLQALQLGPGYAEAHYNLGTVYWDQGKLEEAELYYRQALRLKPDYAKAHVNLGNVLYEQVKLEEAEACYRRALQLKPDFAEVYNNLSSVLRDQVKLEEAMACCNEALRLKPGFADAHINLGNVFRDQGNLGEAEASYRQALLLRPGDATAHNNMGNVYKEAFKLAEAVASYRQAVHCQPDFVVAHSNLLYALIYSPDYDAQTIFEEHQRWNQQHAEPLARYIEPHINDRSPERRLRVGYVSPDFCHHAESCFTVPLLAAHDHQRFEICCYADVVRPDEITARLRSCADVWRNINGLTDQKVADMVRQDQVDILVDLTLHMARNRLLVFARKPAPVPVCWLAYQGTTGLKTMDYRLTDAIIDPPGLFDQYYSEESIRLPDAFWCYDPLAGNAPVSELPAARQGHITFGCLNNFCKVNVPCLRLWAKVLGAVPGSRLMLLAGEGPHRQSTLDLLEREGVQPERVTFVARLPRARYLEHYHDIDIGLDTLPYTGQTTSLDAFWQGVPVVTLVGQTAVGRAGQSLLENLGLPELIAKTPEEFVTSAVSLANDWPRLRELRSSLRDRLRQSPLMDAPRFARNVEAAYRTMWQRWCAGESSQESRVRSQESGVRKNTDL